MDDAVYSEFQKLSDAFKVAFLDELENIASANGRIPSSDLEKFASSEWVDELTKTAIGTALFGQMLQGMKSVGAASKQALVGKQVGGTEGFRVGGLLQKAPSFSPKTLGHKLEHAGQGMQQTLGQRLGAQGFRTTPQELQEIQGAMKAMGRSTGPGLTKRVGGAALEGAGQHMAHSPKLMMLNPVGTPLGGAIEGATRQVGKELVRSTGLAGEVGAGGIRGALGRGLQQHAGKIGIGGEIAGMGALGAAAHLPLSAAGVLGGGMASVSPAVHGALAAGGDVIGHIGADALGSGTLGTTKRMAINAGRIARPLGRLLSAAV